MASVASQLTEEVTAHAQSDSLKDAWEMCTDSTYFPNNLHITCRYSMYCLVYLVYCMSVCDFYLGPKYLNM